MYICIVRNINCIRIEADVEQMTQCKRMISELDSSFNLLSSALSLAGNNVRPKILLHSLNYLITIKY
ncbi:hypothetical protein MNBD_BACTEROID01-2356 [hydrothermal vent metagenome]|uniref:Uncharacterized protein n=1 Tax=hydrothermal vent metagenome TaxID=652676 RepID=A0A3B0TR57_9ZZZZ